MAGSRIDSIVQSSQRRLRLMVAAQIFWILLVCVLGAWWGYLILRNAARIADLEAATGMSAFITQSTWHRTQRMLYWESGVFFALVVLSGVFIFWIYWRDMRRSRSLQAFFASVTHELRTPLTSIRLQAESIAENCENDSSQRELVQRLLEDTMRLEGQVERTLELARVEGGGPVFVQPLEIKPWLESWARARSDEYGGRVEFDTKIEDLTFDADPTALQVILKNLLENSVRHARRERVRVKLEVLASDERAILRFQDNGEGFNGDIRYLGRLFHRGSNSQGTGVGLYLVQVLMRRMGGWVEIGTQDGFRVDLNFGGSHG